MGLSAWRGLLGFYRGRQPDLRGVDRVLRAALAFSVSPAGVRRPRHALTADEASRNTVLIFVLQYFPKRFDFIAAQLDAVRERGLTLGVAGTLGLLWGALGVFGAITTAVNYAWGLEHTPPRTFWMHKLTSFVMLMVAGATLLIAVLLVSASHMVGASWFAGVLSALSGPLCPARPRHPQRDDPAVHPRGRLRVLLRAEHEGAVPGRLDWRRRDRSALERRARGVFLVHARHVRASRGQRIDRGRSWSFWCGSTCRR